MRLYHFTSRHHIRGCLHQGLRLGMVPLSIDPPKVLGGYQWLTSNPDRAQSWNEGSSLPYDRTAYRLTVRVPDSERHRLYEWLSVGPLLVPPPMLADLNAYGDPDNWWLFDGFVPPGWLEDVQRTSTAVPRVTPLTSTGGAT